MKFNSLILVFLMIISSSANASVVTASVAGAVASANASANAYHSEQEHNNAIRSVNNALENRNRILIPCNQRYTGGFFEKPKIDRKLTIKGCDDDKKKFERLNGVKYKFGKAVSFDRYNGDFYFELIEVKGR